MFRRSYLCQVIGSRSVDWLLSFSGSDWSAIYVEPDTLDSPVGKVLQERLKGVLHLEAPLDSAQIDVILIAGTDEEVFLQMKGQEWGTTPRIAVGRNWKALVKLELGSLTQICH